MTIGLVKEIKNNEFRVGLTPDNVKAYAESGCEVLVETSAGVGAGFEDSEYIAAGAKILPNAADIWNQAEMIVKVKEPVASEYGFLKEGQILYTYLHLAADRPLTDALLKAQIGGRNDTIAALEQEYEKRHTWYAQNILKRITEV